MTLNIYLLTQKELNGRGVFTTCVVIAPDEATARLIHPSLEGEGWFTKKRVSKEFEERKAFMEWATDPARVEVTLIGTTSTEGHLCCVVCAGYHP